MENINEEVILFDEGGQLVEKKLIKKQNGFNGMTGEPVYEYCVQTGFNGMTGEPVYVKVDADGFDGMTGQKIFRESGKVAAKSEPVDAPNAVEESAPGAEASETVEDAAPEVEAPETVEADSSEVTETPEVVEDAASEETKIETDVVPVPAYNDNTTSQEEAETPINKIKNTVLGLLKGKNGIIIIAAVAAVVVLAGVIAVAAISGAFIDKHDKLLLATYNTVKDDTIGKAAIDAGEILKSGDITAEYDGKVTYRGVAASVDGTVAANAPKGQYYANASVNVAGVAEQSATVYMDDSMIQVALPEINDKVYEYNYTKSSDEYLAEMVEKSSIGSINDVNTIISAVNRMSKSAPKYKDALAKAVRKEFKKIKLDKADKKTIEIDGKERKCSGYEFELDDDDTDSFVDAYAKTIEDVYGKEMKEALGALENLGTEVDEDSYEESLDKMREALQAFDGVVFRIYTYKGKLACVEIEKGKQELSVEFRGGDTRCSNIRAVMKNDGNKSTLKKKSTVKGGKEEGSITADGNKLFDYEYDTKSGDFEIEAGGEKIKGTILVSGGAIKMNFDGKASGIDADVNLTVKKGARISAIKGTKVNLGDADEDDFAEIGEEIQEAVSGAATNMFMGGFGNSLYETAPAAEEAPAEAWDEYDEEW